MDEEIVRLLKTSAALVGISALAAASRSLLSEDRRSFKGFMRGLILAVFVGCVVGLLISDFKFSPETQGGIVGLAGFIADDLLMIVITASKRLRENPTTLLDYLLRRKG